MRLLFLAAICNISTHAFSQKVVDVSENKIPATTNLFYTVGGEPVNNAKYVSLVEGSPYYDKTFADGKIVLSGGRVYESLSLRLDLMDNTVHYLAPGDEELIATTPLKSIYFIDPVIKTKIRFDHSDFLKTTSKVETGWYQLLDTGMVTLYKRYVKSIRENKPYGSATVEQSILTSSNYYVLINAVFTPVKKIRQLPEMLQDKKTELLEYINGKNLRGKSDQDYIELVSYYNSLVAKK
jgi:hypothetical protein